MRTSALGIAELPTWLQLIKSHAYRLNSSIPRALVSGLGIFPPRPHIRVTLLYIAPCDLFVIVCYASGYTIPRRTATVRDITRIKLLAVQPRR